MMEWWNIGILEEKPVGRAVGSTAGRRSAVPPRGDIPHHSNIPLFQHSSEVIGHIFMNTANNRLIFFFRHAVVTLLLGGMLGLLLTGCATTDATPGRSADPVPRAARSVLRERWGIEVTSLHLSANGRMVDFRYRVLDPKKAALLGDRNVKATLTDLATGAVLRVPSFPKTGSMRQTAMTMQAGRIYFMLFANTGMPVKTGSRVTVTIGDFKAENLIVQ
jgi:hypothetical protein